MQEKHADHLREAQGTTWSDNLCWDFCWIAPLEAILKCELTPLIWANYYPWRIHVWYIYLHLVDFMVNVGKYTSPMDPLGYKSLTSMFLLCKKNHCCDTFRCWACEVNSREELHRASKDWLIEGKCLKRIKPDHLVADNIFFHWRIQGSIPKPLLVVSKLVCSGLWFFRRWSAPASPDEGSAGVAIVTSRRTTCVLFPCLNRFGYGLFSTKLPFGVTSSEVAINCLDW